MLNTQENRFKFINLALLLVISVICFGYIHSLNKNLYTNLYYRYTDLIYFEQSLANFLHGDGLINTGRGEDRSLFSEHAYFSHFLVSLPFYWLSPCALTLYDLATAHILIALILIFFLAKRVLKKTALAWICYFVFFLNIYIIICAGCFWRYGFHSEVFYLAYFLALIFFWDKNKPVAILFFFLALLTKETYAIALFMTMVYFSIKEKGKTKTAPILAAFSLLYFLVTTKWLMPYFGAGKTAYQYYGLHLNTGRAFGTMLFPKFFFEYWKTILIHFHFLPLLSPHIWILALPDSLVNTLSEFLMGYQTPAHPYTWHSIPVYGFMIWGSILSLGKISIILKRKLFIYAFSFLLIAFSIYFLSDSPIPSQAFKKNDENLLISLKKVERLTAGSDSMCVTRDLAAPFIQKRHLFCFPVNYQNSEYILYSAGNKTLWRLAKIQYCVILKTPSLVLVKNLCYKKRGTFTASPAGIKKRN